ncbi:autotransporter-associated beta strand repeat-containing protein [Verrucomicrobiaceae bacterium N1E253]|uniref:Autotransporter-associated beta strand repeat-containing protein n=1 Tax=Oceaniferula marina TaxID=2748318 RepID=A0A851GGM9_9BACT|nr:autotransporter-associated beta strand repeat-containing protein [Oceaniferula marina]NWK56516.1 autotransporter-associated beta strand repeat-containing protein [Oceaniferula marina]
MMNKLTFPLSMGVSMALSVAHADVVVKADNGTSLVTGSSWVDGSAPTDADIAVFNDTYKQTGSLGTGAGLTYYGIRLDGVSVATDVVVNNTTYNNFVSSKEGGIDMSAAVRDLKIVGYVAAGDQEWSLASGRTLTLGGTRFTGTGDVNITGDGTTVINTNGSGAYSGTMTLSGGLLTLNDLDGGDVMVNDAGTLSGEAQMGGDLTLGSSAGASFMMNASTSGALGVANLNLVGTNNVVISGAVTAPGTHDVLTYSNLASGSLANLQVDTASSAKFRNTPTLADTGSAITMTFAAGDNVTWTGANSNAWDVATTQNWNNGAATEFYQLDSVTFNDSASEFTVDVTEDVSVGSITFDNMTAYTLNGAGGITLSSGITANGDATVNNTLAIEGTQNFSAGAGARLTLEGNISGTGGIVFSGPGTMDLSGRSTFSGGVTVNSGEVILSGGGWYQNTAQGSGMLTVNAGATAVNWGSHSFGGGSNPNRHMTLNGGTFQFRSTSYVGDIWMTGGTIENYTGSSGELRTRNGGGGTTVTVEDSAIQSVISVKYNTYANSIITVNDPDTDFLMSGQILGSKKITKNGVGSLLLTANSTGYTGVVEVQSGTLKIGDGGNTGSLGSGGITNNAALIINRSDALTMVNDISGTGTLEKTGAGTLTLTGANTYTGVTTISQGVLSVGDGGTTGTLGSGAVTNNAALVVNRSDALSMGNLISGSGTLEKKGAGTLTLTAANDYTGATTVTEGVLALTGAGAIGSSSSVTIQSGATLDVSALAGGLVVNSGQTLAGEGSITGNVVLATGSGLNVDTASAEMLGISGNLDSSAGGVVVTLSELSNGTISVMSYGGTYTGTAASDFSLTNTTRAANFSSTAASNGEIQVDIGSESKIWSNATANGQWDVNASTNWTGGSDLLFFELDSVTFGDTGAGTVTLQSDLAANDVTFANTAGNDYVLEDLTDGAESLEVTGTLSVTGSGNVTLNASLSNLGGLSHTGTGTLTFASSTDQSYSTAFSGSGAMVKSGPSTMTLTGNGDTTGSFTIDGGTLSLGDGGNSGSLGSGSIVNNAALVINRGNGFTLENAISGSGTLDFIGNGTNSSNFVIGGDSSGFTGAVSIEGARVNVDGGELGTGAMTVKDTGQLWLRTGTLSNALNLNGNGVTEAAGQLGAVRFDDGTELAGSVTLQSDARLTTWIGASATVSGSIGGVGNLEKTGTGSLTLTADNSYTGSTTISQGTLKVGNGGTTGSLGTGAVINNGTLVFDRSDTVTLNGITGGGTITKQGTGLLEVTGDVKANTTSDYITWNFNEGTVAVSKRDQLHDDGISGPAATVFTFDGGTLLYRDGWNDGGNQDNIGSYKQFQINAGGATMSTESNVNVNIDSVIKGSGTLTKTGTGTLTLSTANTYTGKTTIDEGLLSLGVSGSIAASSEIEVKAGASFDVLDVGSTFELQDGQKLGGAGQVLGPIELAQGSVLAPGSSAGTLTMNSSLMLGTGSFLDFELSGSDQTTGSNINDLVAGITDLTLDGTLNVTELVTNDFLNAQSGDRWVLMEYSGTLTDNGLDLGTLPTLTAGLDFELDITTGGQVALTVIPEPSTFTLFGLGAFALILRRKR